MSTAVAVAVIVAVVAGAIAGPLLQRCWLYARGRGCVWKACGSMHTFRRGCGLHIRRRRG